MAILRGSLRPGAEIGGCRLMRCLGRGGMGEVYLATDMMLGRQVALKIIRPDQYDQRSVDRFIQEARMAALIDHPNVITIYNAGQDRGLSFTVMQYVEGQNLRELLGSRRLPSKWPLVTRIIALASQGLGAVHAKGLVHRDVKPSNIMLSTDRRVLLMDFGLVRSAARSELTQTGEFLGTPPYMSPEQCRGEKVDARTDVYSLGATLYTLLAARPPFEGDTLALISKVGGGATPEPLHQVNPLLPQELCRLVEKAMAPSLSNRMQTAEELSRSLDAISQMYHADAPRLWDTLDLSFLRGSGTDGGKPPETPVPEKQSSLRPVRNIPPRPPLPAAPRPLQRWHIAAAALSASVLFAGISVLGYGLLHRERSEPHPTKTRDGMVFIQEGYVQTGADEDKLRNLWKQYIPSEKSIEQLLTIAAREPKGRVLVDDFWIDKYEVTNAEYKRFTDASGHPTPKYWAGPSPPPGKDDHPVVNVTYADAAAYAAWAGKRLPTREQWIRAYRGDHDWLFPWGDSYDAGRANVHDNSAFPVVDTSAVTATPRDISSFGTYNLVGNAAELIRGSFVFEGRTWHVSKGGACNASGFIFGAAPLQFLYGDNTYERGLGFRCVIDSSQGGE